MSILRIYPQKHATVASEAFQFLNSSQDSVAELWYGGNGSRNSISRCLLSFDLTDFTGKTSTFDINSTKITSFKLKMKNAIPRDKVLEPEYEIDILNKAVASSFYLIIFPINKDFDAGRGYDMVQDQNIIVHQIGNSILSGYSNWNSASSTVAWDAQGVYSDITGSTAVTFYSTQRFSIGDEDLDVDITNIIRNNLSGTTASANNGIGIAFRRDFELISGDTRFIASFFTEKTNTAFKPFIEVTYDQTIRDDRHNVTNNRTSRLFLYTFSGNNAVNYYSGTTVLISNPAGTVLSSITPTQLSKGVYYVDVLLPSATRGTKYTDVWSGITFVPGVDRQNFTQTFQIQDNYYFNNTPQVNNYSLVTYGLDNNSIVSNNELLKIFVDVRVNYSTKPPITAYKLLYRMVMNNQSEVITWTEVNQTFMNNCQNNFFTLDTSWLLHNQAYEIQFKVEELGTSRVLSEKINFRVLRPF